MRQEINLGIDERSARLRTAVVMLAVALGLMIVLAELAIRAPFWVGLGIPLFIVSTLVVQAYTGVCPHHAKMGTRSSVHGTEPVLDPARLCSLQARGRAVLMSSLAIGVVTTAIVVGLAAIR